MKKFVCIIASVILSTAALYGCSGENSSDSENSVQKSDVAVIQSSVSDISETDISEQQISSESKNENLSDVSQEESENSFVLPDGVTESGNKLKYTNSVLSLSVTFPKEFCILDQDYTPQYGIYLQNTDGTATLLVESVIDTTTAVNDLAAVLEEKYPDSEIYITDYREIVCKRESVDRAGNEVISFLKVKTKDGGYNEILLTCSVNDKDEFESIFNQIKFS